MPARFKPRTANTSMGAEVTAAKKGTDTTQSDRQTKTDIAAATVATCTPTQAGDKNRVSEPHANCGVNKNQQRAAEDKQHQLHRINLSCRR